MCFWELHDVPELTRLIRDRKPKAGSSLPKQEDVMVGADKGTGQTAIGRRDSSESKTGAVSGAAKPPSYCRRNRRSRSSGIYTERRNHHRCIVISSWKKALVNPVPQMSLSSKELQELQEIDPTLSKVLKSGSVK